MKFDKDYLPIVIVIAVIGILGGIYSDQILPSSNYKLEILNMKDSYLPGEPFNLSTKLSGGSGCGVHKIDYYDLDERLTMAKVIDCARQTDLFKEHPPTFETVISRAPTIPGTYNVTASFEKLKDPVIHEFQVITPNSPIENIPQPETQKEANDIGIIGQNNKINEPGPPHPVRGSGPIEEKD